MVLALHSMALVGRSFQLMSLLFTIATARTHESFYVGSIGHEGIKLDGNALGGGSWLHGTIMG